MRHHVIRAFALLLGGAAAARADTLKVPQDFPTIQAAITAAVAGDDIVVKGGLYAENLILNGKTDVTLSGKGSVRIHPAAGVALIVTGCTGCRIEKLRIEESAGPALITAACTETTFFDLQIEPKPAAGSAMQPVSAESGTQLHFVQVKFTRIPGGAMVIGTPGNGPDHMDVTQCTFTDLVGPAIELVRATVPIVQQCKFTKIQGDALHSAASASVSQLLVGSNTFVKPSESAIDMASALELNVQDNVIKQPGASAIVCTGQFMTLTGNKITKPAGHGILADGIVGTAIDNVIKSPQGDGIRWTGDAQLLVENTISNATGAGITIIGANLVASGNEVTKCATDGVALAAFDVTGSGGLLDLNVVAKSGAAGLRLEGNTMEVNSSKVTKPAGDGLLCDGDGFTLDANTCTGAGGDGFELGGTGAVLTYNIAKGSGGFDLLDNFAGQNTIDASNDFGTVGP